MLKKTILSAIFVSAVLFNGCSDDKAKETKEDKNISANSMVATKEFKLKSLKNEELIVKEGTAGFDLQNAKGKVVIFDIFATWCPPCQGSAMHLSSLQDKFKDDLVIIGVTIEDGITNDKLQEFSKEYKLNTL